MTVGQNRARAGEPARISVIVGHPDAAVRAAAGEALAGEADIVVAGVAINAVEAIELVRRQRPAIVLVDLGAPSRGATAALVEVFTVAPWTTVAIAAADDDEESALAALRRGAAGIVPADLSGLSQAIRIVAGGGAAIPPELAMRLVRELRAGRGAGLRIARSVLTPREWEVLDLICVGASTLQIAVALELTEAAVHGHARRVLRKLDVKTPGAAASAAAALGSRAAG